MSVGQFGLLFIAMNGHFSPGLASLGMAVSSWWLAEAMPAWKLIAMALAMGGLAINLWRRTG